jgi:isochorismate pyruvate lyase
MSDPEIPADRHLPSTTALGSLEEVRAAIDAIDAELVKLLAARGRLVAAAASFKKSEQDVRAPARVEQVVRRARAHAGRAGADGELVEAVFRTMVSEFIRLELARHASAR